MKKLIQYLPMLLLGWCVGCAEDPAIKDIEPLTPDYELPQGESEADDRIVEMYEKYGTYVLYDYTEKDVYYDTGIERGLVIYQSPDPKYVEDMMDFLDKIWFKAYPESFNQQTLPYQIFLTKKIEGLSASTGEVVSEKTVYSGNYSFMVGKCDEKLKDLTQEELRDFKNTLQVALWDFIERQEKVEFPGEFFEVSDYTSVAVSDDETSPDYARARGFLEGYNSAGPTYWYMQLGWPSNTIDDDSDLSAFIGCMLTRSAEEWASDLEWPLVKEKYDILRTHFIENYDVDLQEIGNLMCE